MAVKNKAVRQQNEARFVEFVQSSTLKGRRPAADSFPIRLASATNARTVSAGTRYGTPLIKVPRARLFTCQEREVRAVFANFRRMVLIVGRPAGKTAKFWVYLGRSGVIGDEIRSWYGKEWTGDSRWRALWADYKRFREHGYSGCGI
jgi:hypothetical protein